MKCEIDKERASKIFNGRLPIIIPASLIGIMGGLGIGVHQYAGRLSLFSVLVVVIPISFLLTILAVTISRKVLIRKLVGTIELDADRLTRTSEADGTVSIKRENVGNIKEDTFGLRVTGKEGAVRIPKQIDHYEEFKEELSNSE